MHLPKDVLDVDEIPFPTIDPSRITLRSPMKWARNNLMFGLIIKDEPNASGHILCGHIKIDLYDTVTDGSIVEIVFTEEMIAFEKLALLVDHDVNGRQLLSVIFGCSDVYDMGFVLTSLIQDKVSLAIEADGLDLQAEITLGGPTWRICHTLTREEFDKILPLLTDLPRAFREDYEEALP